MKRKTENGQRTTIYAALLCALLSAPCALLAADKGIHDLPAVISPTTSDEMELWQPGGSSPHDHKISLQQLAGFNASIFDSRYVPLTRKVNGQALSGDITVAAAAGTLTGDTLSGSVTASSLATVGTIVSGTWHGAAIADSYVASAAAWNAKQAALDTIGSTRGSLLERGSSGWTAITPGTYNYILTSRGAGADPVWAAPYSLSNGGNIGGDLNMINASLVLSNGGLIFDAAEGGRVTLLNESTDPDQSVNISVANTPSGTLLSTGSSIDSAQITGLGTAALSAATDYATAAQGAKADSALQPNGNGSSLTGLTKGQVGLGNVENTALSMWTGSTSLTTLGTVATGTWHGTAIADSYIASATAWNAKQNALTAGTDYLAPNGNGSGLTSLNASALASGTVGFDRLPIGTMSSTVAAGDDGRFSDARTPTPHAASHASDGADPITLNEGQVTNLITDLAGKLATNGDASSLSGNPSFGALTVSTINGYTPGSATAATLDTDINAAANSDTAVMSQAAVVSYVANHTGPTVNAALPIITWCSSDPGAGQFSTDETAVGDTTEIMIGTPSELATKTAPGSTLVLTSSGGGSCLFNVTGTGSIGGRATIFVSFVTAPVGIGNWNGSYQMTVWPAVSIATSNISGIINSDQGGAGSITGVLFADGSGTVSTAAGTPSADTVLTGDKSWTSAALVTVNAGWTANASAGDKGVSIPNYTSPVSWIDLTPDGGAFNWEGWAAQKALSDQVAALTAKVQALEAALAAKTLPNN